MLAFLSQPWSWWVAGLLIVGVMLALLLLGQRFGVSSTYRTLCAIGGAGKRISFFNYNWKADSWNLFFIGGSILGGAIASTWLANPEPIALSSQTVSDLSALGIQAELTELVPISIFSWGQWGSFPSLLLILGGGFLIGFGTRYAGGCTSGHAISGLANLQLSSLIAVLGFFIGGLISTFLLFPLIF